LTGELEKTLVCCLETIAVCFCNSNFVFQGGVAVGKSDKHPSYQETKDPGIREEGEHLGRKSNRYAATYLRSLRRRRFQLSEKCQMNNASGRLKSAKSFTH